VLAFVPGKTAGHYEFTSALAVQVLKDLEPRLMPLLLSNKPAPRPVLSATASLRR
jgi:hypothetical protein